MNDKSLETLFYDHLKDIYYAEKQILKSLPKMSAAAQCEELTAAFDKHQAETEVQIERLEQVFRLMGKTPEGKQCPAIDGILKEGEEIMKEFKGVPALDAGLIASAQAVEHYEITRYGTLKSWAECLGMDDAASLLSDTLDEESQTDEDLTSLADSHINDKALPLAA
ncbi:MAG: ferritin-like domain-containing protein [Pseudomonadota bacterium]